MSCGVVGWLGRLGIFYKEETKSCWKRVLMARIWIIDMNSSGVTSLPGWRDAPRSETIHWYFEFKQLWLCERVEISRFFMSVACCGRCWRLLTWLPGKLHSYRRRSPDLRRASFHGETATLRRSTTTELISPFNLIERSDLGFPSHSPGLSSYCQPCSGHMCSCHATSPHRLVPRIQAITLTIITMYFLSCWRPVAGGHVTMPSLSCGRSYLSKIIPACRNK